MSNIRSIFIRNRQMVIQPFMVSGYRRTHNRSKFTKNELKLRCQAKRRQAYCCIAQSKIRERIVRYLSEQLDDSKFFSV